MERREFPRTHVPEQDSKLPEKDVASEPEKKPDDVKEVQVRTSAEEEELRLQPYHDELESAFEEGREPDFSKISPNFLSDLQDIPSSGVHDDMYIRHYESKVNNYKKYAKTLLDTDEEAYSGFGHEKGSLDYAKIISNRSVFSRLDNELTPFEELGRAIIEREEPFFFSEERTYPATGEFARDIDRTEFTQPKKHRTLMGVLGRDWDKIKQFVNPRGTKNTWNIPNPVASLFSVDDMEGKHMDKEMYEKEQREDYGDKIQHQTFGNYGVDEDGNPIPEERRDITEASSDQFGFWRSLQELASKNQVRFSSMAPEEYIRLHDVPQNIPDDAIIDGRNVREQIDEFKDEIKNGGMLYPLHVEYNPFSNKVIGGSNFVAVMAAVEMGLKEMPVAISMNHGSTGTGRYGRDQVKELDNEPQYDYIYGGANIDDLAMDDIFFSRFMTDKTQSWLGRNSKVSDSTMKDVMEEAHIRRISTDAGNSRRIRRTAISNVRDTDDNVIHNYFRIKAEKMGVPKDSYSSVFPQFGWDDMVDFNKLDVENLSAQIYTEDNLRAFEKSERKFWDLYESDEDFKFAVDEQENKMRSYNDKISRGWRSGRYPKVYSGRNIVDIKNILKPRYTKGEDPDGYDDWYIDEKPARKASKKDRRTPIYNFLSASLNPNIAIGDTESFSWGGIAVEFGTEALKENVSYLRKKNKNIKELNPVEYTVLPTTMVGNSMGIDRKIVNLENVNSEYPSNMAHEMEVRIPIGTELNNTIEGIVVDLTKIAVNSNLLDELFPKSDKKFKQVRELIKSYHFDHTGKYSKFGEEVLPNFHNAEIWTDKSSVAEWIEARLNELLGLKEINQSINTWDDKIPRIPIRFKVDSWSGAGDALNDEGGVNLKNSFELGIDHIMESKRR